MNYMGLIESATKITIPCNYITSLWCSVSITWRANYLFVEKKDIVRYITDCKLCMVTLLRKRCTKTTKKIHFHSLWYFLQNKQIVHHAYLFHSSTVPPAAESRLHRFFLTDRKELPTTAPRSVNRYCSPHDIKHTNQNLLLVCTAHLQLKSHPLAAGSDRHLFPSRGTCYFSQPWSWWANHSRLWLHDMKKSFGFYIINWFSLMFAWVWRSVYLMYCPR